MKAICATALSLFLFCSAAASASDRLWVGLFGLESTPNSEALSHPTWLDQYLAAQFPAQSFQLLVEKQRPIRREDPTLKFDFSEYGTITAKQLGQSDTSREFQISAEDASGASLLNFRLVLARKTPVTVVFPQPDGKPPRAFVFAIP